MAEQPHASRPDPGQWILIMEDDPDSAELVAAVLEEGGYRSERADTGRTALNLVKQGPPPVLILLDLLLPDISADELVMKVRHILPSVPPLIIVSAVPRPAMEDAMSRFGGAAVLPKPYMIQQLITLVDSLVEPHPGA